MATLKVSVTAHDHIQGDKDGPITLVEYGDYECPYCGRAHPIVKAVQRHFDRQLRFVYRHFPLTQIHVHAEAAANTAEFAGAHGRFWPMHDLLFENRQRPGLPLFFELAKGLGLSTSELRAALEEGRYAPKIRSDFLGGIRSGVNGTPTFFVNGRRHDGTYEFRDLVQDIEAELLETKVTPG